MLIIVLTDFLWIPNLVFKLLTTYGKISRTTYEEMERAALIQVGLYWLTVLNTALNPLIYCLMSKPFRVCDHKWAIV